jgi:hypothetical protein
MRWVVIFKDKPEMLQIRARKDLRDTHVAYARAHAELRVGGGLKSDPDLPFCGALWVVELDRKAQVEDLIQRDPFYFPQYRTYEIFTWGKILEDQTAVL